MKKYCLNVQNEFLDTIDDNRNSINTKFKDNKTSSSNIKECFVEYSIEDKVEALKNILTYNEKHRQDPLLYKDVHNIRKVIGVKECLQADEETPFQTLISELKNTVMNSYWNKEVGKTHYQVPNLPIGMNPQETTFGKKNKSEETVAELLKVKTDNSGISDHDILFMYKKSHNSYQHGEQINRHYKKPFDQNCYFGQSRNRNLKNTKVKKLLTWIYPDPTTVVNSTLADFKEYAHPHVGEVRNIKNAHLYINMVHGKAKKERETHETANFLCDCSINNKIVLQQKYLQYINSLRQKLKKCIPVISFLDIQEDLFSVDKEYKEILPEDEVFSILAKYKIYVNETLFTPLLNVLQIRKDKNVNYTALLNLLNWKYDFPTLPKIDNLVEKYEQECILSEIPVECQYYNTTYKETLGHVKNINATTIPTAGISSKHLCDKTTAYSLIFPNIFTKYGLSHTDVSKLRSKQEIRSIFECIGVQFSNNSFNLLWEAGLKKDGTDNLSVETFKNLLYQNDLIINENLNND